MLHLHLISLLEAYLVTLPVTMTKHVGSLSVASNTTIVTVPYTIAVVSEVYTQLQVWVEDEFTYYAEGRQCISIFVYNLSKATRSQCYSYN